MIGLMTADARSLDYNSFWAYSGIVGHSRPYTPQTLEHIGGVSVRRVGFIVGCSLRSRHLIFRGTNMGP